MFAQNLDHFVFALENDADYDKQRELLRSCVFTVNYRKSSKWDEDVLNFYEDLQKLKDEAKILFLILLLHFLLLMNKNKLKSCSAAKRLLLQLLNPS